MAATHCIICGNSTDTHIDDRKHRHVQCTVCGGYIVEESFASSYSNVNEVARAAFAAWMARMKHNSNLFLYKKKPRRDNPYSARAGFKMLSLASIQQQNY